jgi:pimeloyl-ACP methyl ester carboxylesterase
MKVLTTLFIAFGLYTSTSAQVKVQLISPGATDNRILIVHGPHIAVRDPVAPSRRQLVLMIEGTGDLAVRMRPIDSCFATMGFHVISIDYPNNVNSITCSNSTDSSCFDDFRQEINFGTPVSTVVQVDSANSIVNRFSKLLIYLAKHDPAGGWAAFLKGNQPRWDKVIVAGHSQGAGHAAYLGKCFKLAGVLMFSGPQDYLKVFNHPAPWQYRKGLTPPGRQFAFLHVKDPYNVRFQTADVSAVTGFPATDTAMVYPGLPIHSTRHILINDLDTRDPHGSTLNPVFIRVWSYMVK